MEDGIPRWLQYHHKACCKKGGVIRQVCEQTSGRVRVRTEIEQ